MEEKNSGENEKTALLLLDRKSRATRGKRLSKLLDDEVQQDELFWSQDALKEEDEDDNYQEEAEIADEFDSDFDQDVSLSLSNSLTTIIN
jgi:vacuolar protein sorting-associated protein 72